MTELIKLMGTAKLVELINEATDPYCGLAFPYIMEVDDESKWEEIGDYMDAHKIACAVENGRFRRTDKWMIVCAETPAIYTFSDNETLFGYMAAEDIAQLFAENGIELMITPKYYDNEHKD